MESVYIFHDVDFMKGWLGCRDSVFSFVRLCRKHDILIEYLVDVARKGNGNGTGSGKGMFQESSYNVFMCFWKCFRMELDEF